MLPVIRQWISQIFLCLTRHTITVLTKMPVRKLIIVVISVNHVAPVNAVSVDFEVLAASNFRHR